jgi:hypothetical protein
MGKKLRVEISVATALMFTQVNEAREKGPELNFSSVALAVNS